MFKNQKIALMSLEERFLSKVNKTATCWLWVDSTRWNGYGRIKVGGKLIYAYRLAWELYKGSIPAGMCVLHKCDVPACVNPEHLFLGTRVDNNHDRSIKGRNGGCKLTKEQVIEIRHSALSGVRLASLYNVSQGHISDIRYGLRHKDEALQ